MEEEVRFRTTGDKELRHGRSGVIFSEDCSHSVTEHDEREEAMGALL